MVTASHHMASAFSITLYSPIYQSRLCNRCSVTLGRSATPGRASARKSLLHILYFFISLGPTESLLHQRCLCELTDVAIQHGGGVRGRHAGAEILHHLL